MAQGMSSHECEQRKWELAEALNSSLDLNAVVKEAYPLLLSLTGAEFCALAVSRPEPSEGYEWIAPDLPRSFLASYNEEMAADDYVQKAVMANVGKVMRDSEMIDRRGLERNMMYQRARESGTALEHVMAVMLVADHNLQSGLSLYRKTKRPFTADEQRMLQDLTRLLCKTIRNCSLFARLASRKTILGESNDNVALLAKVEKLTAAERDVVLRICRGLNDKDIARERGTAPSTVKKQASKIYRKLGIESHRQIMAKLSGLL